MIVVPPWPAPRVAATERGATVPVASIGCAGGAYEASPRPPPDTPVLAAGYVWGAAIGGGKACDWYCGCGREYCGSSRRAAAGAATEPVASGCEANGFEKGSCERRVDMSALQPAKPNEISASAATCGTRREQSNSATRDMVTHSYAAKYCFV